MNRVFIQYDNKRFDKEYYIYKMRKFLFLFFLLFTVTVFSQTNPVASDVSSAHFKDTDGLIHLVGSDAEYGVLTYTIVSLPSHGTLKDPLNSDAVVSAGGTLTGNLVTFTPHSDENHKYIFSGTNSFTYKVTDSGSLDSDTKTVTVKVFDSYLNPPTLIGAEIDGEAAGDNFGRSVSLNENGTIMAVGAPYNDAGVASSDKGHVRVYNYNGTAWSPIGGDIDGSTNGDYFGSSVSLSADGTILAVGIPYNDDAGGTNPGQVKIYKYDGTVWNAMGVITPTIIASGSNKAVSEHFGNDVRLSSDGKTLAVSDIWFDRSGGSNAGRVVVYRYDGSNWASLGSEVALYGSNSDNFSWGISLSDNGNILAVGSHENDDAKTNAGQVKVYEYDSDNTEWDVKATLLGIESYDKFGAAVDLNSSGLILAVGSTYHRPSGSGTNFLGKVGVYSWDGTTYSALGSSIVGSDKYDYLGAHLSLDNEGNTLAVMGPGHDDTSGSTYLNKGRVRIYNYDIGTTGWVQSPTSYDIDGEENNNQSASGNAESKGQRVFLSGDGSVLAIGADENDGNGTDSGHVRVYKLFEPQIIPVAASQTVGFILYEQVDSEDITLSGTDGDSGPSDLVYIITELNTARLIEGGTSIVASDIPHTLTGKVVKYNSNSDVVVNDTFKFIVHDGKASSVPATVTLTVTPDNDAPVATPQSVTTDEDVAIDAITLAATDVDSPQVDLIYIIETLPAKGTLKEGGTAITAAGTILTAKDIIYTPNSNYSGADSFTFKVKDKGVGSDGVTDVETSVSAATVDITVNNTDNDPPISENQSLSVAEETETGTITLVATDPDDDDSSLTYTIATLPSSGTLKDGGTVITAAGDLSGALTYTPNTDFVGNDTFTFTAKDDEAAVSNAATVTISVSNTNDPPVAQGQALTTNEETETGTITLVAVDPDLDDTPKPGTPFYMDTSGDAKDVVVSGNYAYVADEDSGLAIIDISNPASPGSPVYVDTSGSAHGVTVSGDYAYVADYTSGLAIIDISNPASPGSPVYMNTGDARGVTVSGNYAYVAAYDKGLAIINISDPTNPGSPVYMDTDGFSYNVAISGDYAYVADSTKGLAIINISDPTNPGSPVYESTSTSCTGCDPYDVAIIGNYAYVAGSSPGLAIIDISDPTNPGSALWKDTNGYALGISISGNYAFLSLGGAGLGIINISDPTNPGMPVYMATRGDAQGVTVSGNYAYVADDKAGFPSYSSGLAIIPLNMSSLTYIIASLPTNGKLKDGGTVITAAGDLSGALTYTPNTDFNGDDTFTFTAKDDKAAVSNAATVTITVSPVNDPPISENQSLSVAEETETGTITLVATDVDDNNATLTYTIATLPSSGILKDGGTAITATGTDLSGALTYTSNTDFVGDDTFTFTAKDDEAEVSNAATVTISVSNVNDPPVAQNQSLTAEEETETGTINLVATDVDDDNATLTYTIATLPSNGTLKAGGTVITAAGDLSGALTYTPNTEFNGDDTFTFTAKDDEAAVSNTATVTITVNEFNDPPTANDQSVSAVEQTPITITLTGSDSETVNLIYIISTLAGEGTLSNNNTIINAADLPKSLGKSSFTQLGPDFTFASGASSTSLSSDGTKMSFNIFGANNRGLVKVFSWDGTSWAQLGNDIVGQADGDYFGVSNSLSSDGTKIAIGASYSDGNGENSGHTGVYSWDGTTWIQLGADILGEAANDLAGGAVSLSNDGTKLAVGANYNDGNGDYSGHARIFSWDGTNWTQLGDDIDGENARDKFGETITLSGDGNRVAIGSPENGIQQGHLRIYDWNGTSWVQVGDDIDGKSTAEGQNQSTFLSDDGTTVVIGSVAANKSRGYARVFRYDGTQWAQIGEIVGDAEGDRFGSSVSLSSNGNRLVVGMWLKNFPGDSKGRVRVYDYNGATWSQNGPDIIGNIDKNRFGYEVFISTDGTKISASNNNMYDQIAGATNYLKVFEIIESSGNQVVYTGTSETPSPDSFTFKVKDEGGKQSTAATVSITVGATNDPPEATPQTVETDEDTPKEITHAGTDDDGDSLTYIIVTLPSKGALKDGETEIASADLPKTLSSAKATYTPEANYNGADSYTFKAYDGTAESSAATVDITIKAVNDPPTANNQNLKTDEDIALEIKLTGSDPEDDPLTYIVKTLPTNGILKDGGNIILASELPKLLPAESLTYVPNANFIGNDSFNFIINANFLNSFTEANGLKYITQDGVPVTYQKPEGKTYFLIQNETGQSGFNPVDWPVAKTLTESIGGAGMYVILNAEMAALVMNGLNDMGIGKGTSNLYWLGLYQDKTSSDYAEPGRENQNWGGWTWTDGVTLKDRGYHNWLPGEPNNAGAEDYGQMNWSQQGEPWNDMHLGGGQSWPLFEFSINDNTDSNTATISIEVESINDPPVANAQTITINEDAVDAAITLTGTDSESQPLTYIIDALPNKGTLKESGTAIATADLPKTLTGNALTYSPNADYYGNDALTFKVNDGVHESSSAIVSIVVNPVNDPPESDPQTVNTDEDVPVDITHVGRDKDLVNIFTVHTQMGADINLGSNWAEYLEISADGETMVVGGWTNNKVKVFKWSGTTWDQLGSDIEGGSGGDFGEFVSISSDGKRVAVGAPKYDGNKGLVRVFEWDGTKWTQKGDDLDGNGSADRLGFRGVHISGDGNTIAAASYKGGYVNTYNWDGTNWTQTGNISIDKSSGIAPGQVSLSSDGARLAIGNVASNGNQGKVVIFDWDGTNTWNQYVSIDGNSGDKFGNTLSISRDGKKLVSGVNGAGSARVYDLSGSSATQVGTDINYGSNAAWRAISMSDDGNRVAIPVYSQKTGVFDWDGISWNQLGEDLVATSDEGESLDMSSDGKTLAIGGHSGLIKVFNILNLTYIITSLPSNGILKEGSKTITASDLPFTLKGTDATYVPNAGFYGNDKYNFKLNDGKADSTNSLNGKREDSQVTIIIKEFVLILPNNYKITPTETCKGSDFGILDIEVAATSYKKTAAGPDIPITYKISIEGKGELATIVSPDKTAQIKDLPAGKHKLIFKVVQEPKYEEIIEVEITASDPPVAYAVAKLEVCDDAVDQDDSNGKVNFDTSAILNTLLKNPSTGVVQDEKLFDIEFTYFDQATSANVTKATLPNPLYSASQTISVKFISKINRKCIGTQTIDFQVNTLPVIDRIETNISVCTNLDPVTIGVASKDSRAYTYTWTRNGTAFAPNIAGIDSSILIGLGGEYIVTATTKDGTSCSKSLTIQIKESSIATVEKKDIVVTDLNAGPNNTITIKTETLGIGDYEYAIDDKTGPYQDEPVFENIRPGLHTIYIRDKNECGVAKIDVSVIGYKKFFTPNGDGIHDTWNIIGLSKINQPKTKIYIFDRFGKLLKELDPLSSGWDGTFIGKPMPSTDYWFRVYLEDGREFKSHFSLVRPW